MISTDFQACLRDRDFFALWDGGRRLRCGDKGTLDDGLGLLTWCLEWNCRLRRGDRGSLDDVLDYWHGVWRELRRSVD